MHGNSAGRAGHVTLPAVLLASLVAGAAAYAADPVFETSDPNGGWSDGGYYVHNNMWNSAAYTPCTETLYAWSYDNWYVVAMMNDSTGDGAVKTYPNVHKNFSGELVSSFGAITSTFAETSPHVGIYNVAFDIWINGVASPGCTEIMIWTENYNQSPGGSYVQDVTFAGRPFEVYKSADDVYIAFVAVTDFTSGTVDLLEIMNWAISQGWLATDSTLNQICFGIEIVSTDDLDAMFQITDFSIATADQAPVAQLVAPANGATVGGAIAIEATAHDPAVDTTDGSGIESVLFELLDSGDTIASHTDTGSPYGWMLGTASWADGDYTIRATATSAAHGAAIVTASVSVDNSTDADGDGLVDGWEDFYFGDLSATAGDDPDGDGATNLEESDGGTDPTDVDSIPSDDDGGSPLSCGGGTAGTLGALHVLLAAVVVMCLFRRRSSRTALDLTLMSSRRPGPPAPTHWRDDASD